MRSQGGPPWTRNAYVSTFKGYSEPGEIPAIANSRAGLRLFHPAHRPPARVG
jgi:hypothetical protein